MTISATAAFCLLVGIAGIEKGDQVVTVSATRLMAGYEELAKIPAGTELVAGEVQGKWIAVTMHRNGRKVSGWIQASHLKRFESGANDAEMEKSWTERGRSFVEKALASPRRVVTGITSQDGSNIWLAFPQTIYQDTESLEEAIRCFDKVMEINPASATAWYMKGFSLKCMGEYDKAIACLDKAIKLDPKNADQSWNLKARSLRELNRLEEAIGCYEEAIEVATEDSVKAELLFSKGLTCVELERVDEARKAFELAAGLGHTGANSELKELQ